MEEPHQADTLCLSARRRAAQARRVASNALEHPPSVQPWRSISFDSTKLCPPGDLYKSNLAVPACISHVDVFSALRLFVWDMLLIKAGKLPVRDTREYPCRIGRFAFLLGRNAIVPPVLGSALHRKTRANSAT